MSLGSGLTKSCTWVPSRRLWNTQNNTKEFQLQRWTLDSSDSLPSPLGLLEELFGNDPWRMLLSTIFLNRTQRVQVDVVMHSFLQQWPTAESVAAANVNEISTVIAPMGIRHRRARGIVQFSKEYLALLKSKVDQDETMKTSKEASFHLTQDEIKRFYNCGQYVADAYRIFIQRDWTTNSTDHALEAYVEWKRGLGSLKGTTSRLSSAT
jgi:methyl-CpG-binding domain protein 4